MATDRITGSSIELLGVRDLVNSGRVMIYSNPLRLGNLVISVGDLSINVDLPDDAVMEVNLRKRVEAYLRENDFYLAHSTEGEITFSDLGVNRPFLQGDLYHKSRS